MNLVGDLRYVSEPASTPRSRRTTSPSHPRSRVRAAGRSRPEGRPRVPQGVGGRVSPRLGRTPPGVLAEGQVRQVAARAKRRGRRSTATCSCTAASPPAMADRSIEAINDAHSRGASGTPRTRAARCRRRPTVRSGTEASPSNPMPPSRTTSDRVLANFGVSHIVVGHTTMPGAVVARLGGKVLLIDVGLSKGYGGRQACLVVERGTPMALHRGSLLKLPLDASSDAVVAYLRAAAALDPAPSPLLRLIEAGGRLPSSGQRPGKAQGVDRHSAGCWAEAVASRDAWAAASWPGRPPPGHGRDHHGYDPHSAVHCAAASTVAARGA